jgi:hypothetical protein
MNPLTAIIVAAGVTAAVGLFVVIAEMMFS